MKSVFRAVSIRFVYGIFLATMLGIQADAQSEFSSVQGFPYDVFDRLPTTDIDVPGGTIHLGFAPGRVALPKTTIVEWVQRSAKAITTYYGRFPVKSVRILIVPMPGIRVQGGTTWGYRGGAIRISLGSDAGLEDLQRDWIMVHEMVHLALPNLPPQYKWLSEGLAVYVEPIARVQSGDLSALGVWSAMMRDMPKGLPKKDDKGLNNTSTWARTYWGGAIFCLLADIEIRKRSNNRVGLQDAMRGILTAGGNHEINWSLENVLAIADGAVGLDVMTRMHARMGNHAASSDLNDVWRDLGLVLGENGLLFDDNAPLATTRIAITRAMK